MSRSLLQATFATIAFTATASAAFAGSVLQPGGTVGLAAGAPLPEGIYFIDTSSYGQRTTTQAGQEINLSQFVWATPFTAYDTRLQFVFLQPSAATTNTATNTFFANSTLFAAQLAHTFNNGFGVSYQAGFRAGMPSPLAFVRSSFEQRGAVSYTADGFDLTANVINGLFAEDSSRLYSNWLNVDLTLTKKFGKVEAGLIAFGSSDLSSPTAAYRRQGQIAVGGLLGYKFEAFTLQSYVSHDVSKRAYTGYDTRGFVRLTLPLYVAPTASAPMPIRARF